MRINIKGGVSAAIGVVTRKPGARSQNLNGCGILREDPFPIEKSERMSQGVDSTKVHQSVRTEDDFDIDRHVYRLAVQRSGFEFPVFQNSADR